MKKLNINFLGSGWEVKGVRLRRVNCLMDKEKVMTLPTRTINGKEFFKFVVCERDKKTPGKPGFYVKEWKTKDELREIENNQHDENNIDH